MNSTWFETEMQQIRQHRQCPSSSQSSLPKLSQLDSHHSGCRCYIFPHMQPLFHVKIYRCVIFRSSSMCSWYNEQQWTPSSKQLNDDSPPSGPVRCSWKHCCFQAGLLCPPTLDIGTAWQGEKLQLPKLWGLRNPKESGDVVVRFHLDTSVSHLGNDIGHDSCHDASLKLLG